MATTGVNVKMGVSGVGQFKRDINGAADSVGGLNSQLGNIERGISWQNLTEGLKDITDQLEKGAQAAINFGRKISNSAKDSAKWADDLKTTAAQFDIPTDQLQRMQKVSEFIDTDVEAILTAQSRMRRAVSTAGGKKTLEETLGISLNGQSSEDLFWEIGDALMNMGDAFDKESAAQSVFGRSWRELVPLFKTGRESYEAMLSEQSVLTDEQVDKLGEVDDMFHTIEQEIEQMKNQFWAENADKIMELMQWLMDNKDAVVDALKVIAGGFALIKIGEFAGNLGKAVSGFRGLFGFGGGGAGGAGAAGGGAAAGSAGGGAGFLGTVGKAAPFIAPAAVLLDSVIRGQQQINEDLQRGAEAMAEIADKEAAFSGDAMYGMWKTLTDYMHASGSGPEDFDRAQEFAKHFMQWVEDDLQDEMLDQLHEGMTNDEYEQFRESMRQLAEGKFDEGTDVDEFTEPILRALEIMEELMGTGKNGDQETLESLKGVPGQMVTAVQKGVSGIRVTLDGQQVGNLVAPYVSQWIARDIQ